MAATLAKAQVAHVEADHPDALLFRFTRASSPRRKKLFGLTILPEPLALPGSGGLFFSSFSRRVRLTAAEGVQLTLAWL